MKKQFILGLAVCAGLFLASCQGNDPELNTKVADFEDVTLNEDLTNAHYTEKGTTTFLSGDNFAFETYTDVSEWGTYYYGFVASAQQDNKFESYVDAYKSACGGAKSGKSFAVWYSSYYGGDKVLMKQPAVINGCYLNNNAYAYNSMLNGDAYSKKFGADDWFLLTITGYNGETETGKVEFYLAQNGKIINEWTYCDLSSLGEVNQLTFALTSSDNGDFGMNTPAYFCIDDLGAKK